MMSALATLPQADRYELLKTWTMPTADRKSVRLIAGVIPGSDSPQAFDVLRGNSPRPPRDSQISSTANFLIQAAIDSGRLEELQKELLPHVEQNVEQSKFLLQLIQIAQGKGAEVLPDLQNLITERKRPKEGAEAQQQLQNQNTNDLSDAVLARAAISDPNLRDNGRELMALSMARSTYALNPLSIMSRHDYFAPVLEANTVDRLDHEPWNSGLKHWIANSKKLGASASAGSVTNWWLVNEGILCHILGSGINHISLKYPLTGEFEVSFDAWSAAGFDNGLGFGYGDVNFTATDIANAQNYGYQGNGRDVQQMRFARIKHGSFNRVRLQVSPEKVRYYVNGDLIQEDSKSAASAPWIFSYCYGFSSTAIRNFKIEGQPKIPREVKLVSSEFLTGWISGFYGESQPQPPPEIKPVFDSEEEELSQQPQVENEFDWKAKDLVIHGRRVPPVGLEKKRLIQSRLYYDHPLSEGDRIQYEFWYETGENSVHVHPAMGRLAFLLEVDGVKLHWMTAVNSSDEIQNGLPMDNVLVNETIRREPVSLNEKSWNNVDISLKNSTVTISLNGKLVCEAPLERENSRQFGFYHDKNASSVQVRNVVLQGDWPESLSSEIASNLLAPDRELTRAERLGYSRVINESFHSNSVDDRLSETGRLSPGDRFNALAAWILPNDDHFSMRLYGSFSAANGIPEVTDFASILTGPKGSGNDGRRQYASPDLVAPVFELIALAKELKRLDELKPHADPQADDDATLKRSRLAFRTLIQIASDQLTEANEGLGQLVPLTQALPDDAPALERWPELIAAHAGFQHAELRPAVLPLLNLMLEQHRKHPFDNYWESRVVALRDRCKSLMETDQYPRAGGLSPKSQWVSSRTENAGDHPWSPASRWSFRDGIVTHLGGEGDGALYFQSPLRGSFKVDAEVTTSRWTESRLMYHGTWAGSEYTKTMITIGNLTTQTQGPKIEPILEFDEWCRLTMDVQPNKALWYINDRQVHELILPDKTDPWLALTTSANHSGQVRKVRITGSPEIPAEIDLSATDDLTGWTASLYGDPMNSQNNRQQFDQSNEAWKISSHEIVGTKFDLVRNQQRQSLLQYHRPIAEDAEVSYEFFYTPGDTHVHPALGRIAFLLDDDGVKLHLLTDFDSERIGLRPDNAIEDPTHRRLEGKIPLKSKEWNRLQLKLVGDQVQLILNGVDIYQSPVANWNQRQFGLFHYANQTDIRVRNVILRGEWPKALPELKDQELSEVKP